MLDIHELALEVLEQYEWVKPYGGDILNAADIVFYDNFEDEDDPDCLIYKMMVAEARKLLGGE